MLDRTEQRIVGVLLEKELAVPDSYPLTLNALVAACNQKSNRDPEMALEEFEVQGALMSLRLKEWVAESERDGGRTARYRHQVERKLQIDAREKAVVAELLLRGPQTPMELKARVPRMGFAAAGPADVEAVLQALANRTTGALVEQMARAPRERDARWAHLLGPREAGGGAARPAGAPVALAITGSSKASLDPQAPPPPDLEARLQALEQRVAELERRLAPDS
jgi:hypothetical protein